MSPTLINLSEDRRSPSPLHSNLFMYLRILVGEPFQFVRVSYGDELTLHFGELRPARSPKLKDKLYGAYLLGLRGSPWVFKSGSESEIVSTLGEWGELSPPEFVQCLSKEHLESRHWVVPGSCVTSATPHVMKPHNVIGLRLQFSDGSSLWVQPTVENSDEPADDGLPEIADWELLSPYGLLEAGPGLHWSFTPRADPTRHQGESESG